MSSITALSKIKAHVLTSMPELGSIYVDRYERNKSMSEIGKDSNKSLQTIRNRLLLIWHRLESNAPELVTEVKSMKLDDGFASNISKDIASYTGRHVFMNDKNNHDSPINFNVGKRSNLNLLSDIKESLAAHKESSPSEQLYAAFKVANTGNKGAIAISRFGIRRDHSMTLDEVGDKYNLTRERIRQIASFMARLVFVAEKELGYGPMSAFIQCINSTFKPGSGALDRVNKVMESAGVDGICEHGMAYLLYSLGIQNITMRGEPYLHDPLMTADAVAKEIKSRERYFRIVSKAEKKSKQATVQTLIVCSPEMLANLDNKVKHSEEKLQSRGDFISKHLSREILNNAKVEEVQWKSSTWITRTVRIETDLFNLISQVAFERGVTKTALMNAGIVEISKPH